MATSRLRRLLSLTTALGLAFPVLPAAQAQDAGNGAAPPGRVGQIAALSGNVSFNGAGSGGWAAAARNYPVAAGDSLYTEDDSSAAIALNSSEISLASDTELQVTTLGDDNFAATESQGEIALALNGLQPGETYTIATPRGNVGISQNGEYDILAGDQNTPTVVNVFQGQASISAPGVDLQVNPGQAGVLSGTSQTTVQLGQAQQDSFTNGVFGQSSAPPPCAASGCAQMTGVSELGRYGDWAQSSQYGPVWYPTVAAGWAPYRYGHWAYIPPWGWTWVEDEPWGFAPFHYGRWIDDGDRWGWVPSAYYGGGYAPSYQPVYAPAVVSFFGVAAAAGITAALLSSGSVGWVPLAPGEPYYPPYPAPETYIRRMNIVNVRNINDIHIANNYYYSGFTPDRLANHRGATFVPVDVMRRGGRVAGNAHMPGPQELALARPIGFGHGPGSAPGPAPGSAPGGEHAAFRLPPPSRPLAQMHPGRAPRPSAFAGRHAPPPAILSHTPYAGHPGTMAPHPAHGPMPALNRPNFAPMPGYHAPPAPPHPGQHLAPLPPATNFHPQNNHAPQGMMPPQFGHPAGNPAMAQPPKAPFPAPPAPHPAPARQFHPAMPPPHPQGPIARPQQPEQRPPAAPAYHPPAAQFHPQPPAQPRPMEMPRPMAQPHPMEIPHPVAPPHPMVAPHPMEAPHPMAPPAPEHGPPNHP